MNARMIKFVKLQRVHPLWAPRRECGTEAQPLTQIASPRQLHINEQIETRSDLISSQLFVLEGS